MAKNEITSSNLKVSEDITVQDSEKPKDTVLSTDPLPGTTVSKDSVIKLTVSSGKKKEKTIEVSVNLPKTDNEITVSSYIDGVFESTKKIIPSYSQGKYTVNVNGSSGKKKVSINIDGKLYKVYEIDFDAKSNNVKETESKPYKSSSTNQDDESKEYNN